MPTIIWKYSILYDQTDPQIVAGKRKRLDRISRQPEELPKSIITAMQKDIEEDKQHGAQMVIDQYRKQISKSKDKSDKDTYNKSSQDSKFVLELGDKFALGLLKMGAGGGKAKGILSAAVEYWPKLQRPFAKDPIDDVIQTDSFRGKSIKNLPLPWIDSLV